MSVDWRAIRFESPAGRWYLVHDEKDRSVFAKPDSEGIMRSVFSRDELIAIERGIGREPTDEGKGMAQELLQTLINVKQEIPGAKLRWMKQT